MSAFGQFSEAAKLYAQHWVVVEAMATEFQKSVDVFLDALYERIGAIVAPSQLQQKLVDSTRNRYWWLAEDDRDRDAYPQLWLDGRLPTIVVPGELRFTAIAPRATGEQLRRLADLATQPALARFCAKATGRAWSLFTVVVQYPDTDPVESAAEPIATVLMTLRDAVSAQ